MYEQAFQEKTIELKEKIKLLKKELKVKGITAEEKMKINNSTAKMNNLIARLNVKKLKLRELPNGQIVNLLILDKFLEKLKGFDYQLNATDDGLVIEYWKMLDHGEPTGKLTLFNLKEHYADFDIPYLEGGYPLGTIQTA